jgi:hypothetical protein
MKLKHLTSAAMMVASWLLAGSCAVDDRRPGVGSGGSTGVSGVANSGAGGQGSSVATALPRLQIGTVAIDLGWVTTGFPVRTRIRVDNTGDAPLAPLTAGFAEGSHADFSLVQNGCALEVAPGESCELRVQLVPSDSGERTATLEVQSDVGGEAQVVLSASGLAAGDLILAPVPGSFEDFGGARIGATGEETFSISNPSDVASGPLRFRVNRPEFALLEPREGDCIPDQTSLVAGQSCTLRVAFTPNQRGPLEATLTGASDGVGAVSITLLGRGLLPAALSVSALTVDFAGVVLGSSAQRSVLFENAGDEPLTLAGARLAPENAEGFSILSSDCGAGAQIEGGAHCSVQLEFRPPGVGEEMTAELIAEGVEPGQTQSVPLRGLGLEQGPLIVSAQAEGDTDFGDILVGQSTERLYQIQNPSAQPSGVLDLALSEGFALSPPSEGAVDGCLTGSTSLVNGETCTVRVLFTPSRRERFTGSLTVSSPLAGATDLPLRGRGILPAQLGVQRELNFGRVLTGSAGARALAIENEGDEPLAPPRFELLGNAPTQVAAFSFDSRCTAPLAPGQACNVNLTFAPTVATAYAVTLNVSSARGNTPVLLLAEAQVPGALVLTASDSAAFGDVPVGTTVTRSFVLQNPGQVPSGRLTISSDNNRFEVDLGDCNPGDPAGLAVDASCTFNIRFTPDDNLPQFANLSVHSPGAGRAALQISGQGRRPALLSAASNRDLGRANVGEGAVSGAQNEFTWTVDNQGDLPTDALALENDNPTEFDVRDDTCSGSVIPGGGSCEMIIGFRPSAAGNRLARVVVSDGASGSSATLALTGLGVQLAALGESCVNAECAAGVCTRGVCCDRACDRTCQVCSAEGQCIDQSNQEACGNGAACFGVDNCKLPGGRACSQNGGDAQCGSGQCEPRLGGTGPSDRICCLDDCGTSLLCNAESRCQTPTLGDGEACGAPGQLACGPGLSCKACSGGGNRCTPNDLCCGACPGNQTCINGTCGCNAQQIDCGGGLCIPNAANVCCPGTPECSAQRPFCDTRDNVCKECLQNNNCTNGPANTVGTCVNNTCSYACDTQRAKPCNGACIPNNQCCNCNGACQTCNNGTCAPVAAGQPGRCTGGQVCNQNGQCVSAGAPPGSVCAQNSDCQSNSCRDWSPDGDGDGFGAPGVIVRRCGPPGAGFVGNDDDCCDSDIEARPTQTQFFSRERTGCGGFDFNCSNGSVQTNPPLASCGSFGIANCPGVVSSEMNCGGNAAGGACFPILIDPVTGIQGSICDDPNNPNCRCTGVRGAQVAQTCQ